MAQSLKTAVPRPVQVMRELCSRYRCNKSDCTACVNVCPVLGAVQFTEQGAEIAASCVGCGACASACPNGAIRTLEGDDRLAARLRSQTRLEEPLRIGCSWVQGQVDVIVPCLARLTEALLLEPLHAGASSVELASPDCAACGFKKGAPQWQKVLDFTRGLCAVAGGDSSRLLHVVTPRGKAQEAAAAPGPKLSRRAMFRAVAERWKAIGIGVSAEEAEQEHVETFREVVQRRGVNPKRGDLLRVLARMQTDKGAERVVPAAGVPLAQLAVERSKCVGCNVCETLCPAGALHHREQDGTYVLEFDASLCTGCGVCEAACFHQAIQIKDTVNLAALLQPGYVPLVSAQRRTCPACRESFLDDKAQYCPTCLLSGDRRSAIARQHFLGGLKSD